MTHPVIPTSVIAAAQAADRKWGIPASVTIAQWALESAWGSHMPAGSNNPFGIKATGLQAFVSAPTREVIGGKSITINAKFRRFADLVEAFDEHGRLLAQGGAYALARGFEQDDAKFANALTGHYATDPHYGSLLNAIMSGANLAQYDIA
jgi:flagellum-specific peptidoglycan hydrolase FlgJ